MDRFTRALMIAALLACGPVATSADAAVVREAPAPPSTAEYRVDATSVPVEFFGLDKAWEWIKAHVPDTSSGDGGPRCKTVITFGTDGKGNPVYATTTKCSAA